MTSPHFSVFDHTWESLGTLPSKGTTGTVVSTQMPDKTSRYFAKVGSPKPYLLHLHKDWQPDLCEKRHKVIAKVLLLKHTSALLRSALEFIFKAYIFKSNTVMDLI